MKTVSIISVHALVAVSPNDKSIVTEYTLGDSGVTSRTRRGCCAHVRRAAAWLGHGGVISPLLTAG